MKKILAFALALTLLFALAACGKNEPVENDTNEDVVIDVMPPEAEDDKAEEPAADDDKPLEEENNDAASDEKNGDKKEEPKKDNPTKPVVKDEQKPSQKPAEQKPSQKPAEQKPQTPPAAQKPAEKPSTPPEAPAPDTNEGSTLGQKLSAIWRANSGKSSEAIANAVLAHKELEFPSGVVEVSEGFLTGFANTEIKGFSKGYMFAPMIGTIPFVGYVFETDAPDALIATLKAGADLRWNVCTEAEEMIVEKSGSKVFFLMCPKSFETEE